MKKKKTLATLTIIITAVLALTACAPATPEDQARSIAQTWLDSGDGWCGAGTGELVRTTMAGGKATKVEPGGKDGYWVAIDYAVEGRTHHGEVGVVGVVMDAACVESAELGTE